MHWEFLAKLRSSLNYLSVFVWNFSVFISCFLESLDVSSPNDGVWSGPKMTLPWTILISGLLTFGNILLHEPLSHHVWLKRKDGDHFQTPWFFSHANISNRASPYVFNASHWITINFFGLKVRIPRMIFFMVGFATSNSDEVQMSFKEQACYLFFCLVARWQ